MDNDSITWKGSNVFHVKGPYARPGEFKSKDGQTYKFTTEFLDSIYDKFNKPVPFYLTHADRDKIGWLYKVGNDGENEHFYEGFVFDEDKRRRIEEEGFDKVSPEIDIVLNSNGDAIDGTLLGMAFTRTPAIADTTLEGHIVSFSTIDEPIIEKEEKIEGENEMTEDVSVLKAQFEEEKNSIMTDHKNKIAEFEASIESLTQELEDAKNTTASIMEKYDAILTKQSEGVVAELKSLGFKEPEKIGASLSAEQRFDVLVGVKSQFAKSAPLMKSGDDLDNTDAPKKQKGKSAKEVAEKMGLGKYAKYVE